MLNITSDSLLPRTDQKPHRDAGGGLEWIIAGKVGDTEVSVTIFVGPYADNHSTEQVTVPTFDVPLKAAGDHMDNLLILIAFVMRKLVVELLVFMISAFKS
jgi:hypothetical protein